ncbi:unnamed protein product [Owenia fusiformis]|uniref:Uncharacterized protein n=1 Tax=Owenia fusiformis TaxID=6347 RepID=A0A8J1TXN5_OWEFU|nr:unnamed protein product [Owenia fusiformis]
MEENIANSEVPISMGTEKVNTTSEHDVDMHADYAEPMDSNQQQTPEHFHSGNETVDDDDESESTTTAVYENDIQAHTTDIENKEFISETTENDQRDVVETDGNLDIEPSADEADIEQLTDETKYLEQSANESQHEQSVDETNIQTDDNLEEEQHDVDHENVEHELSESEVTQCDQYNIKEDTNNEEAYENMNTVKMENETEIHDDTTKVKEECSTEPSLVEIQKEIEQHNEQVDIKEDIKVEVKKEVDNEVEQVEEEMEDGELEDGELDDDGVEEEVPPPLPQDDPPPMPPAPEQDAPMPSGGDSAAGSDNDDEKQSRRRKRRKKKKNKEKDDKEHKKSSRHSKKRPRYVDHDHIDNDFAALDAQQPWGNKRSKRSSPPGPYDSPDASPERDATTSKSYGGGGLYGSGYKSPPGPYDSPYQSPPGPYDSPSDTEANGYDDSRGKRSMLSMVNDNYFDPSVAASEKQAPSGMYEKKQRGGKKQPSQKKIEKRRQYLERQNQRRGGDGGNTGKIGICKFYLEGNCQKGDECQFDHNGELIKRPELCKFYITSICQKGENCVYMHGDYPCKYFFLEDKRCFAGDDCKFSHEPLNDVTGPIIEKIRQEIDEERKAKKKNSLLGSPPRLSEELQAKLEAQKKIPSLFDIQTFAPGTSPHKPMTAMNNQSGAGDSGNMGGNMGGSGGNMGGNNMAQMGNRMLRPNFYADMSSPARPGGPMGPPGMGMSPMRPNVPNPLGMMMNSPLGAALTMAAAAQAQGFYNNFYNQGGQQQSGQQMAPSEQTNEEAGGGTPENTEDKADFDIPTNLPQTQKDLLMRIQNQQKSPNQEKQENNESKDENDDNWYSSDEDAASKPKLADVLKNLAHNAPTKESKEAPMSQMSNQANSTQGANQSHLPTFDIGKMLSIIRHGPEQDSTNSNKPKDPRMAPPISDPRTKPAEITSPRPEPVEIPIKEAPAERYHGSYKLIAISLSLRNKPHFTVNPEDPKYRKDPRIEKYANEYRPEAEKPVRRSSAEVKQNIVPDPRLSKSQGQINFNPPISMPNLSQPPPGYPIMPPFNPLLANRPPMGMGPGAQGFMGGNQGFGMSQGMQNMTRPQRPQDPRSMPNPNDPRNQNKRVDPRIQNKPNDPRSQNKPNDPRTRSDPRLQNNNDSPSQGQNTDPRFQNKSQDPRLQQNTDPRLRNVGATDPRSGNQSPNAPNSSPRDLPPLLEANPPTVHRTTAPPPSSRPSLKPFIDRQQSLQEGSSGDDSEAQVDPKLLWGAQKDKKDSDDGSISPKTDPSTSRDYRSGAKFKIKKKSSTGNNENDASQQRKGYIGVRKGSMDYASPLGAESKQDGQSSYSTYNRPPNNTAYNKKPLKSEKAKTVKDNSAMDTDVSVTVANMPAPPTLTSSNYDETQARVSPLNGLQNMDTNSDPNVNVKDLFKTIDPTASPFC